MAKVDYYTEIGSGISKYVVTNQKSPETIEFNQNTYNDIYDYAMENVEGVEIDKTTDRPMDPKTTFFGMKMVINNRMKDGNWKII